MRRLLLSALISFSIFYCQAQNVGIGETSPTARLDIKGNGSSAATNTLLIRNSDNNRLLHLDGTGAATYGNISFPVPGHIIGIHNGLLQTKAHLALYATGATVTDAGSINRIGFSNLTNGTRQFEIQSYSGTNLAAHSLSFKYLDFSSGSTTTDILTLNANGTAVFGSMVSVPSVSASIVSGSTISTGNLVITSGGESGDFMMKEGTGTGFRKGHGAQGLNYIICIGGTAPTTGGPTPASAPLLGEVRMWAGTTAPSGWAFCHGQLLPVASYTGLFAVIGTYYGGNGTTTFALPDLKGATAVGQGVPASGQTWTIGERSY